MDVLFDDTMQMLSREMTLRVLKHQVISANIANAETPGYARLRMDFETALTRAAGAREVQAATHRRHMQAGSDAPAVVYRERAQRVIGDGNNVVLEQEMKELAENQLRYEAAVQLFNKKLNMLKTVIQERA
ncbi:MAG: flagellar basal body rod protein FlgB [Deltaproteobacteria bacterium]|nr:flagellar basal body rod protein FlgB [Deltaproteobacteria bacterium]